VPPSCFHGSTAAPSPRSGPWGGSHSTTSPAASPTKIFGRGLEEGQQKGRLEGRQVEAAAMALRLLQRRCGALPSDQQQRIQALSAAGLMPYHTQQLPGELGTWGNPNWGSGGDAGERQCLGQTGCAFSSARLLPLAGGDDPGPLRPAHGRCFLQCSAAGWGRGGGLG
jgi:hypothetical protein